jgi:hypothetical protein
MYLTGKVSQGKNARGKDVQRVSNSSTFLYYCFLFSCDPELVAMRTICSLEFLPRVLAPFFHSFIILSSA